ncbi:MAG: FtsW/RodA/SpoVE family cell cycle protein [Patescibacteria group bacterium]|nr:FtsW/RodA/SpoVE family cell cycle protein [Patescibacteria group bacterium]
MLFDGRQDWYVVGASAFLMMAGLLVLASSDHYLFIRQIIWIILALGIMVGLPFFNIKSLLSYRWFVIGIYLAALGLLVITYFIAPAVHGARSWIPLGPFKVQPSEFMQAALIILFSAFFAAKHISIANLRIVATSFVYFFIPTVLIMLQPNLGTAIICFGIWFGYLLVSEMPAKYIGAAIVVLAIVGVFMWHFGFASYQKARIIGLFNPHKDTLGINYNAAQSKITIGSGGFFGEGFGQGTEVKLGFLPAAQTDFAFASFIEEWGFLGGAIVLLVFAFLIYRILRIGMKADNNILRFLSLGTVMFIVLHLAVNLGSVTGLLPVVGEGMPFVSYGGSDLITVAGLIGVLQGMKSS